MGRLDLALDQHSQWANQPHGANYGVRPDYVPKFSYRSLSLLSLLRCLGYKQFCASVALLLYCALGTMSIFYSITGDPLLFSRYFS
jgi:hypothetical protein